MFGAGRCDITPPLERRMAGFANRTQGADGVISPLYATAFVLDLNDVRAVFISVDVIGIGRDDSAAIRNAVAAVTNADPQRIVLATTHTHSGPVTTFFRIAQPEPTYMAQLTDGIVAAARDAASSVTQARMEFAATQAPEFHMNRRNADLPIDSTLSVLRFVSQNGTTLGAWVNFGCHPTILGGKNTKWSADYAGFMRETIEAKWPGIVGFFNGCHGDVNAAMSDRVLSEAQRIGRALGEKVLQLEERFTSVPVDRLEGGSTMVSVSLADALSIDELDGHFPLPRSIRGKRKRKPIQGHIPDTVPVGDRCCPVEIPRNEIIEEIFKFSDRQAFLKFPNSAGIEPVIGQLDVDGGQLMGMCIKVGITFRLPPVDRVVDVAGVAGSRFDLIDDDPVRIAVDAVDAASNHQHEPIGLHLMGYGYLRGVSVRTGFLNLLMGANTVNRAARAEEDVLEVSGTEDMLDQCPNRNLKDLLQYRLS